MKKRHKSAHVECKIKEDSDKNWPKYYRFLRADLELFLFDAESLHCGTFSSAAVSSHIGISFFLIRSASASLDSVPADNVTVRRRPTKLVLTQRFLTYHERYLMLLLPINSESS